MPGETGETGEKGNMETSTETQAQEAITNEIGDMLGVKTKPDKKVDAGDKVKDESKTDSKTETETEPKVETETKTETDDKPDEVAELKSQVEKLMAVINDLTTGKGIQGEPTEKKPDEQKTESDKKSEPKPEPEPEPEKKPELEDILGGVPFIEIIESEETFRGFLDKFSKRIQTETAETVLKSIPQVVTSYTSNVIKMQKLVDDFYSENKALTTVKPLVGATLNQVTSEHPDWEMSKAIEEAGKRVYKALGLKKEAIESATAEVKKTSEKRPAFAKANSTRRLDTPVLEGLEGEIAAMIGT